MHCKRQHSINYVGQLYCDHVLHVSKFFSFFLQASLISLFIQGGFLSLQIIILLGRKFVKILMMQSVRNLT